MKRRHRHTIMSGRVVTFAEDFDNPNARFPDSPEPTGIYEISASRDEVNIHCCGLKSPAQLDEIKEVLELAIKEHDYLKRSNGRPDDDDSGEVQGARLEQAEEHPSLTFSQEHIEFVSRFGGVCHDCGDENGICPSSGLPCQDSKKAIKHVLNAIEYGINGGHVKPASK